MLYAGIDIHKSVFQAVVLEPDSGELSESRFEPSRERLGEWASEWQGKLAAVAIDTEVDHRRARTSEPPEHQDLPDGIPMARPAYPA